MPSPTAASAALEQQQERERGPASPCHPTTPTLLLFFPEQQALTAAWSAGPRLVNTKPAAVGTGFLSSMGGWRAQLPSNSPSCSSSHGTGRPTGEQPLIQVSHPWLQSCRQQAETALPLHQTATQIPAPVQTPREVSAPALMDKYSAPRPPLQSFSSSLPVGNEDPVPSLFS